MNQFKSFLGTLRTSHILFGMSGCVLLFILISPLFVSRKFDQTVTLVPRQSLLVGLFPLKAGKLGAARVEVKADLPKQRWATYEVQLLDLDNQVLLAGVKNAWRETGTWKEGRRSGTWDERDQRSGFDLQVPQDESVKVALALAEVSDNRGRPVQESVAFQVSVHEGVVDTVPLWFACMGLLGLGVMRWRK